jgi:hypothetical protein
MNNKELFKKQTEDIEKANVAIQTQMRLLNDEVTKLQNAINSVSQDYIFTDEELFNKINWDNVSDTPLWDKILQTQRKHLVRCVTKKGDYKCPHANSIEKFSSDCKNKFYFVKGSTNVPRRFCDECKAEKKKSYIRVIKTRNRERSRLKKKQKKE